MKIRYFSDTDTVYIELTDRGVVDTMDMNDYTIADLDADGNLVALTVEHAQERATISDFSFQQLSSAPSRVLA